MSDSSLQDIVNAPEIVPAFGRTYAISKFTLGPLCQALPYIGPMVVLLEKLQKVPRVGRVLKQGEPEQLLPDFSTQAGQELILSAFNLCGDSVFGLISIATKEPMEWLEQQDAIDGVSLFAKVVQKNLSFFSPSEIERLTKAFGGLLQQTQESGGESSTT